jgi:hypothetical protein
MKITDNFLPQEVFSYVKNEMLGSWIPWYYNPFISDEEQKELDNFQFTHMFYINDSIQTDFFYLIKDLVEKINPSEIIRIKANLRTKTEKNIIGGFHTDLDIPCTTAVFYFNTNNGYTLFKDGTRVESIENRLVEFDSSTEHSSVSQTDTQVRCVLNLNYKK